MSERLYADHEAESLGHFVMLMGRELARNTHKKGWRTCTPKWLLMRLKQEVKELERALKKGDRTAIAEEAADVGNFAMMVQDKFWDRP